MRRPVPRATAVLAVLTSVPLVAGVARAQEVVDVTEELDFSRPESWAMKYFASLAQPTGMGVPQAMGVGGVSLGFEGGIVPQLREEERRVGFGGTKVEDLNKTRVFGRLRGAIGLSRSTSLELAYTPPVEVGGARPHLFSVAIGRPFQLAPRWRLGVRGYGHIGTIEGDITCSAEEVAAGADPELNPFRCEEPSSDTATQRLAGAEVSAGYESGQWRPWAGFALTYMDLEFQVDARHSGLVDHTLQLTDGFTYSITAGMGVALSERWSLSAELFYSWLSVRRPPAASASNEGLLNGRLLVSYRIR
jgi:hypothetical protein